MVRVRFAPSPTGPLHIGGLRTALFNYLFTKQHKGTFILRIEDTDRTRFEPLSEAHIFDSMSWCGIVPDESPLHGGAFGSYRQSERKIIYKKYIDILINNGHAYYAFDTKEELEQERKNYEKNKKTFIYNHLNRLDLRNSLSLDEKEVTKLTENVPYVIRFKIPTNTNVSIKDMIRGNINFDSNLLDDKILFKSDGTPTYHLANIIDDHLMNISHVIRGEEWLPSTPLHYLLYKAFEWKVPQFAHLPLLLKPTGKGKLSKRDGDKLGIPVFAINYKKNENTYIGYKEKGYLPESLINFLAFLGWHPQDNKEIYSLKELIEAFDFKHIQSGGAIFDIEKLNWYNQQYIQKVPEESLAIIYQDQIAKEKNINITKEKALQIINNIKERAVQTTDFISLGHYLIESPNDYNSKALKKSWNENSKDHLKKYIPILSSSNTTTIENTTKNWIESNNIPMGKFMQALRIALTGDLTGINLFDIIAIIGIDDSRSRIESLLKK